MTNIQNEKDKFFDAVDSLKKYRRAEITDETGISLVDTLYTDLLPNEQILKSCLKDNTTFLIGRKGTGKSTLFLKLQNEYRKKSNTLSCYIDTKTVFESSQTDILSAEYLSGIITDKSLNRYLLEKNFVQSILEELIKEIQKKSVSRLDKVKELIGMTIVKNTVEEKLKILNGTIINNEHLKEIEVPALQRLSVTRKTSSEQGNEVALSDDDKLGVKISPKEVGFDANSSFNKTLKDSSKNSSGLEEQFSDVLLRVFQIKNFITQIKEILAILEIKSLVILLDDFSEIPDQAMRIFVDVILAPLNNWSEEFIKFKVAAYPNRVHYGNIDQGKIDKINLDFYNLYSNVDRSVMEERAIDFTKRLIDKRIEHYTGQQSEHFFDTKAATMDRYYELIFQISMNVPRIIGYILFYCYESRIAYGKSINQAALREAAQRYYEQTIETFFQNTVYSLKSFDEKISILQLRELTQSFVDEMLKIKKEIITGELTGSIYDKTNPHTSHFHFSPIHEQFLKTLELNFFVSKYSEMSGRDGGKQSIYCLNYGLCVKNNLRWGKPKGNDFRKYFISRPFDFNNLIETFLRNSKRINCINSECNKIFPFEQLQFLEEVLGMKCPNCHSPIKVFSNSDSIKEELEKIDNAKLLPDVELGILYEVRKSEKRLKPKEIAQELDCSYQLVGKRAKKLDEDKELLLRDEENGQRVYKLTEKAKEDYFSEADS